MSEATLNLHPLDKRTMTDFERLLSGKEFGGCYCSVWTSYDDKWEERCKNRPHENLEHTRLRIQKGEHVGFLVNRESDGAVVAWTGSGPKTGFPLLKESPGARKGSWDDSVWAIGCLSIGFSFRSQGYARKIVDLLVAEAAAAGAETLEAYPAYPAEEPAAYRGGRKLYEAAGFTVADEDEKDGKKILRMVKTIEKKTPEPKAEAEGGTPAREQ
ncbi:MAG: GNAT family N-acetyltransferase, partial [Elusimicrobiota bacterium]